MVRMITEDEMERSKQEKTSEQLKLKKQITDIVENLKEKLNRAIQELKAIKDENQRLQDEVDATKAALEEVRSKGPAPAGDAPAGESDPGLLDTLKAEIGELRSIVTEKDKTIEIGRKTLDKTTADKEELEQRISDLTGDLHQMTDSMAKPEPKTTPVFAPVEEAAPAKQAAPQSRSRLLSGKGNGEGSILGSKKAETKLKPTEPVTMPEQIPVKEAKPDEAEEATVPAAVTEVHGPIPISDDVGEQAICPVCGGEGVIGVRKKDGSIVQEVCPNCRGAGKV